MSLWKIYYTDGTSFQSDDPVLGLQGDVTLIPVLQRFGVHSLIQPMGLPGVDRDTIEQYNYLHLKQEDKWIGVGFDGLLDYLMFNLNNMDCVLQGRQSAPDAFFALRKEIAKDQYIVGFAP